jgi:hypothetical protein
LKIGRRKFKPERFWSTANDWTWKLVDENWSLRSSEEQKTIELVIGRRQLQPAKPEVQLQLILTAWASWWILPIAKNNQRSKKMLQGGRKWRKNMQKVETQAQTVEVVNSGLITKFIYRLDGPLGERNI